MPFSDPSLIYTVIALIFAVGIMALLLRHYTTRLERRIDDFLHVEQDREDELRARERLVIAAALEGELTANLSKIEAFLLIYTELLRSFKEPGRAPKYKSGGEIIHERPALARTIFDAYVDRLERLGPSLAGDLAGIYAQVEEDPEYKTLDADLSADAAIRTIERIVQNAKALKEPIEQSIAGLAVVVRDKKKRPGMPG